ncbi:MAG TPA: MaoC family dehydratase [Anaerolineae bacterium]|nr:MaoC family dehydratase [Anaerolineae bacterium]
MRASQVETVERLFRQADFDRFAAISGDDNPIHVDPAFAARTRFGRTVAHGMFLYSLVSGVLGTRLPGPGTLQVDQELVFPNPTYAQEVTVRVEVIDVDPDGGLADLATAVLRADGTPGLEGRTRVRLPGAGAPAGPATGAVQGTPAPSDCDCLKGLTIGQRAETRRTFGRHDLAEYVDLTGDANPLFTDGAYARRLGFAGPLVPGSLLGGMVSFLLGTRLPGQGTNYLKQRLEFPSPAYADQELVAAVEVIRLRGQKQLVNLTTTCLNPCGEVVCRGEALVLVGDVQER